MDENKPNTSSPMDVDCTNTGNPPVSTTSTENMPEDGRGDGETSKKCMKKDDSGISVEKIDDSDDTSSGEDVKPNDSDKIERGKGKGLAKLDVTKPEVIDESSPDSGHNDSDSLSNGNEARDSKRGHYSLVNDSDDDDDDGDQSEVVDKMMRKARRVDKDFLDTIFYKMDAKDSDDDDDEVDETEKKRKAEKEVEKEEEELKAKKPRHNWFLCPEILNRQYGTSNRFDNALFCVRCSGSVHAVERLELMYKMKKHDGCVNTLHFNHTGTRLASGSDDLNVVIWDWTVDTPVLVYDSGHRSNVFQAKFIPFSGDCHIVSCARDGQIRLAELSSTGICKGTRRLAQHRGSAHKLALNYDSPQTFLSCGDDALVYEVDLRESKPEKLVICKEDERKVSLYTIFINPGNPYEFALGGRDHFVRVYDKRKITETNPTLKKFCPHQLLSSEVRANVTCLVYNYNGSEILATYNDEDIYTFDSSHSDGADYTHRYQGHRNNATVKGVNYFGGKSEFIVSGSDCGNIYMWEHDSERVVNFFAGDEGGVVNCLEPHPNLPVLATSGLDDDVKIWVPSCETSPSLAGLKSIMQTNMKGREDDRHREPEAIDGQMLWYFMHHLRRTARRRVRWNPLEAEARQVMDESSSDENSENSDEDEDEDTPQTVQCNPS
uniref:Uncharacterized protein n=1 Tax=Strigamia maritima TaxID=126957 RepID=T1JM69_STRMM